jgi:phosphoglycolate phosphatase-like HAD superfamily hydrolase
VLDLDGVLLDTLPVMREAWRAVGDRHGVEVPFADYRQHLGRPFGDIMRLLGLDGDAERIHETYARVAEEAAGRVRLFDGVQETLHGFVGAGWRLGVVTSKPLVRAAPLLARLGCPFAAVRTPGSVGRGKPAPDLLLLALVDLGVDPGAAAYVGDMAVDHECARRAGVPYVHAAWGYGAPGSPVPRTAGVPGDLLGLLGGDRGPFLEGSLV